MPNIIASPRNNPITTINGPVGTTGGVSIERINKNISDSINNGKSNNKEIQLI